MSDAIFLSAGVPDPLRGPEYAKSADSVAIAAAVSALVFVTLGRRLLVWGGQPSITPMIWVVAKELGVEYGGWVKLYQSRYFEDAFPEDNKSFQNVIYTENIGGDRKESLREMRKRMFSEQQFDAAVFIGGMGGIIEECQLFHSLQPKATLLPLPSTGGAALELSEGLPNLDRDVKEDLDYIGLFHRHLGISVKELRYADPKDQPPRIEQRLWPGDRR
jgi:hypothetical protein